MSYNSTFTPQGATVVVSNSAVQVNTSNNVYPSSYRIRNLLSTAAYISWAPQEPNNAAVTPTLVTPVAGTPAPYTVGMLPNSVETFCLPPNCWFIASATNAFEVTPGEGM